MNYSTERTLQKAACLIHLRGLHTGEQFAENTERGALDVCAAIFIVAEQRTPSEFYTDEVASLRLIEASAPAMQAIRALSNTLDTQPPVTEIAPGVEIPDYIEHVSNWAATTPIGHTTPPTTSEVIGRILRAARDISTSYPAAA